MPTRKMLATEIRTVTITDKGTGKSVEYDVFDEAEKREDGKVWGRRYDSITRQDTSSRSEVQQQIPDWTILHDEADKVDVEHRPFFKQ